MTPSCVGTMNAPTLAKGGGGCNRRARSRVDAGRLRVLAFAEAALDVLLGVLLGQLLLAFAEAAVVVLVRRVGQFLLAFAEASDALVLGEYFGRSLAFLEAVFGL